jgi:hypothetical protein
VRDFAAEAHVCHVGDPANVWIGVVDGLVRMVSLLSSGKSVTFVALPSGSWFKEGSALKREIRKHTVIAVRPSRELGEKYGILFRPPDNVIRDFSQFPVTRTYEELRAAFERADQR